MTPKAPLYVSKRPHLSLYAGDLHMVSREHSALDRSRPVLPRG